MGRKGRLFAVLLGLTLLVSVVFHMPATVVLSSVPLPKELQLSGVTGTPWEGRALSASWKGQPLGEVAWTLRSQKLFVGRGEFHVRFGGEKITGLHGQGNIGYGAGGITVENFTGSLPAALLARMVSVPVPAFGQVDVTIDRLKYQASQCDEGEGKAVWGEASVSLPLGSLRLGDVNAELQCKDGVMEIAGDQESSQLNTQFTAQVKPNRSYKVQALISPKSRFPSVMEQQLRYFAKPDKQGKYYISIGQ